MKTSIPDIAVEIACAIVERAADLVEQKMPTSKALRQAAQEMRAYGERSVGTQILGKIQLP